MGDRKDESPAGDRGGYTGNVTPPAENRRGSFWPLGTGGLVLVAGIGAAIWYFGVYDTAAGKCNRGDLGACLVVAAQQSASAAVASASASVVAAQESAAVQASFDAKMSSGCTVGPPVDYNVRVVFVGKNKDSDCATAKSNGWLDASRVDGATIVCDSTGLSDDEVVVEDTGGQYYGGLMCQGLNAGQLKGWNDIDPTARNAVNSAAQAIVNDIQSLSSAGDAINGAMKDADNDVQKARADLNQTAADLQAVSTCSDSYKVQSDSYTVQSDQYSMQSVQYSEQAATGQVTNEISSLVSDFKTLQSAEAPASGYVPSNSPTQAQVSAAEKTANAAVAQGDKRMAGYLSTVQAIVNQANVDATAAGQKGGC